MHRRERSAPLERASLRLHISYANIGPEPNFENYVARVAAS